MGNKIFAASLTISCIAPSSNESNRGYIIETVFSTGSAMTLVGTYAAAHITKLSNTSIGLRTGVTACVFVSGVILTMIGMRKARIYVSPNTISP